MARNKRNNLRSNRFVCCIPHRSRLLLQHRRLLWFWASHQNRFVLNSFGWSAPCVQSNPSRNIWWNYLEAYKCSEQRVQVGMCKTWLAKVVAQIFTYLQQYCRCNRFNIPPHILWLLEVQLRKMISLAPGMLLSLSYRLIMNWFSLWLFAAFHAILLLQVNSMFSKLVATPLAVASAALIDAQHSLSPQIRADQHVLTALKQHVRWEEMAVWLSIVRTELRIRQGDYFSWPSTI